MKNKFINQALSMGAFVGMTLILILTCPTATSLEANIPSENNNTPTATEEVVEEIPIKELFKETKYLKEHEKEWRPKEEIKSKEEVSIKKETLKKETPKVDKKEGAVVAKTSGLSVPAVSHDFKSYTAYTCLSRKSPQWTKIQSIAYSDANGLRKVGDYYCVAMGSYYSTTLGDLFRVSTTSGNTFKVILCDFKANAHTDSTHRYTARNQCITEFYVDYSCFNAAARSAGSASVIPGLGGKIKSIEYLGNYFVD